MSFEVEVGACECCNPCNPATYWEGDGAGGWRIDPMGGGDACEACDPPGTPVPPPYPSVAEFEPGIGTCE